MTPFRVGAWSVEPRTGEISRAGEIIRLEARPLRLLLLLSSRAGEVLSVNELLDGVWDGVVVTPDSVYQAIASLRRQLGDDPKQPSYILTVPRLGYRLVANVGPADPRAGAAVSASHGAASTSLAAAASAPSARRMRAPAILIGGLMLVLLVVLAASFTYARLSARSAAHAALPRSVAVLPFQDLTTQDMNEEFFADGLTEELIGDLGRVPGLQVPSPTSSFYFKGKQLPIGDIAHRLGVAYVLDGSVRKSGTTYRVATRLVRADDGFVVWTDTYERPLGDLLAVQRSIAAEAAAAIRMMIERDKVS